MLHIIGSESLCRFQGLSYIVKIYVQRVITAQSERYDVIST